MIIFVVSFLMFTNSQFLIKYYLIIVHIYTKRVFINLKCHLLYVYNIIFIKRYAEVLFP